MMKAIRIWRSLRPWHIHIIQSETDIMVMKSQAHHAEHSGLNTTSSLVNMRSSECDQIYFAYATPASAPEEESAPSFLPSLHYSVFPVAWS
jgi:hypothetical protein